MRTLRFTIISLLLLLLSVSVHAQMRFTENGKQWPAHVLFRTDIPGGKLYLEKNRLTVDLYDTETTARVFSAHSGEKERLEIPEFLQCHAYRINFSGASNAAETAGQNAFAGRYNYFIGNDPDKWSTDLKAYASVRYTNLYPGIDLKVYENGRAKYDFIVAPGADPAQIALEYEGVKPKKDGDGNLVLKTAAGEVKESRPFAYQITDGSVVTVSCEYDVRRNTVRFALGDYDTSRELIIDPELIFSTYSGSTADNFGYTATYDAQGHLYAGSSVFGTGYPVTSGAYQAAWAGGTGAGALAGTDIALTKFSLDGTSLIYSTYLGGSGDELPHSLITDDQNNLYMLGTSGSDNYPVLPGAYQPGFAGGQSTTLGGVGVAYTQGCDITVTGLNPSGNGLIGSTYVGGTENDGINTASGLRYNYADEVRGEIELDAAGNVMVGSSTRSADFPTSAGAFQTEKQNTQDGVVFRMNPQLTELLASTFYGGNGGDAIYSIDISPHGVTAGGGTRSSDLAQAGSPYQPGFGGGAADGFLAVFSEDLSTLEAATYFGSGAYDQIYFTERDAQGRVHCFGQTEAADDTFIINADYAVPNSGMLLAKFEPDLENIIWSTVFGDGNNVPNISPGAFSVDICNRIYLSGWGGNVNNQGSTQGLPVTPDALQSSTNGSDFYFLVIDGDASELTFATFFGGGTSNEHVDGGTSRFDRSGKIYQAVCAGCGSNDDFPIHPENAWSPTNNSFNCNLGVTKIDFNLPLVIADFETESVCLPEPVSFVNNSVTGSEQSVFIWDFGDGNTSNLPAPEHLYDAPGTYTVSLTVWDGAACNVADTLTLTVDVFEGVDITIADEVFSCTENTFELTAEGFAETYTWAADPDFENVLAQGPEANTYTADADEPTVIYLLAESGICSAEAEVAVFPPPAASFTPSDTLICASAEITATLSSLTSDAFSDFVWEPEALLAEGQGTPVAVFESDTGFVISVTALSQFGCEVTASAAVEVFPVALEAPADTLLCNDEPLTLTANSFGTATSFEWAADPDFSEILNTPGDSSTAVVPSGFQHFYIRITNGPCTLTDSTAVSFFNAGTTVSEDRLICAGDTTLLTVLNDFPGTELTHFWEPEEFIISGQGTNTASVFADEAVTFTVVSTALDGACVIENSVTVFTSPLGELSFTAAADPPVITPGGSSTLTVAPVDEAYDYFWSPESSLSSPVGSSVTAFPSTTTEYALTVADSDSAGTCVKNEFVIVTVVDAVCGEPNIFVPNAFTPNGDGENDVLYVRGLNIVNLKFAVYDRWGELVFETDDQDRGWDGTYKGREAGPAVFVYHLEADCGDGQSYFTKGNVTLIR